MKFSQMSRVCMLGLFFFGMPVSNPATHAGDLEGIWRVTAESDRGESTSVWHFQRSEGKLTGVSVNENDEREFSTIKLDDSRLQLGITLQANGRNVEITANTKVGDDEISGTWTANDDSGNELAQGAVNAKKDVPASILLGEWKVSAESDEEDFSVSWNIQREGFDLAGTTSSIQDPDEKLEMQNLTVSDDQLSFSVPVEVDNEDLRIEVSGKIAQGEIKGEWSAFSSDRTKVASGDLAATKVGYQLVGTWSSVAELPDGNELNSSLVVNSQGEGLTAEIGPEDQRTKCDKISLTGDEVRIEFDLTMQGNTIEVVIEARFESENTLEGKWNVIGDDGQPASGRWAATRN